VDDIDDRLTVRIGQVGGGHGDFFHGISVSICWEIKQQRCCVIVKKILS
jgi:hypothetical protein